MIQCDINKGMQISGYPPQIAAEFNLLARGVRERLQEVLGEEVGRELYEISLRNAMMSMEESARNIAIKIKLAREENPEKVALAELMADVLVSAISSENEDNSEENDGRCE